MRLILFLCVAVLVVRPTRTVPEFCVGTLGATSAVVASYHAREAVVCLSFLLVDLCFDDLLSFVGAFCCQVAVPIVAEWRSRLLPNSNSKI